MKKNRSEDFARTIISTAKSHNGDLLSCFSSASSKGSLKLLMQLNRECNQLFNSKSFCFAVCI